MKQTCPIIIKGIEGDCFVRIPDFDIAIQRIDIIDAMNMARDVIGEKWRNTKTTPFLHVQGYSVLVKSPVGHS